jgi:hypothetical protein
MKTKLVLISIVYQGITRSAFVMGQVDENGKASVHPKIWEKLTSGIPRGATISVF